MAKPTKQQILDEIRREVRMRVKVYPRLVEQRKLDQKKADRRMDCLIEAQRFIEANMPDDHNKQQ